MAGSGFRWEDTSLFENSREANRRVDAMVATTIEYFSTRAEGYARQNAPWTDRTSNARNSLTATPRHFPFVRHEIIIAGGMPYSIWLEVRWSGRFGIIEDTKLNIGRQVLDMIGRGWGPAVSGRGTV